MASIFEPQEAHRPEPGGFFSKPQDGQTTIFAAIMVSLVIALWMRAGTKTTVPMRPSFMLRRIDR
jgi:hypothetical protein